MFLDEFAGDPKAEAGAGIFLRGEEGFEDVVEMLGRDAEAGVSDGDAHADARWIAGINRGPRLNADGGPVCAGVKAVGQEIGENLTQLAGVAEDLSFCFRFDDEGHPLVPRAR